MLQDSATARFMLLALAATLATACRSDPGFFEPGEHDFAGRVTVVQTGGEFLKVLLVAEPASPGGERVVRISDETRLITRGRDGVYRPVSEVQFRLGRFFA